MVHPAGSYTLNVRLPYVRALMASAAIAAAIALGGCESDGVNATKAMKPLSSEMTAELEKKGMPKESPILVRLFKEEAELEIWKQDTSGRYTLLRTYPICRWSGELGPKIKEGDRQAPEGFYTITKAQMNPNSAYYLSFDMGYPNAFDRAHGRTGSNLMVHGDCSSRGCYAMTDEQIGEIYALARESFFGGQRSFQVQAYPFRMTAANFARHRNNPNMPFWRMLKEGNDHFEVTRLEPKIDVCEKRYVFDAEPPANATPIPALNNNATPATPAALKFNATAKCPAYQISPELAAAVAEKQKTDNEQIAELTRRGVPVAPIKTYADGGMNPVFQAKLNPREIRDSDGTVRLVVDQPAPGTVPPTVNPPHAPDLSPETPTGALASNAPTPPARPASAPTRVASAPPPAQSDGGNLFARLFRFGGEDQKPTPVAQPQAAAAPVPSPRPAQRPAQAASAVAAAPVAAPIPHASPRPQPQQAQTIDVPPVESAPRPVAAAASANPSTTASAPSVISGAQPVVPTGSFDSRWSALR
jgi:murein L,D-transpeptidase YafK